MSGAAELRRLLAGGDLVVAPGAYDALTARLVAQAGFPAVYMTGAGVAVSRGLPDYGLLTMSEMAQCLERMARAVTIPVIADGDTGYGNELNVVRTVEEYAFRGAAAIQIEDQTFPKRCGHLDAKQVIPAGDFVRKIRAAAESRPDPAVVLIARTDAVATDGIDAAIERANQALEAGADVAFVEAPTDRDMLAAIPRRVHGPCLINIVAGGKTPPLDLAAAREVGYRIAIVPVLVTNAVITAVDRALAELRTSGEHPESVPLLSVSELFLQADSGRWDDLRGRYGDVGTTSPTDTTGDAGSASS
jgi:2-methylisocitrate lyase-like PEP mutase family enzyme